MSAYFSKLTHAYRTGIAYLCRTMTPRRWIMLALGLVISGLLSLYLLSPIAVVERLSLALAREDIATLKAEIPASLLTHLIPKQLPSSNPAHPWQGAGKTYLQQVWPQLYKDTDRHAWLSIQAQSLKKQQHQHYQGNLNHYVLEYGSGREQIRFTYQRHDLIQWRLIQVDYPNTQPDLVAKRLASSSR